MAKSGTGKIGAGKALVGGKRPRMQRATKAQASAATRQRRFLERLSESCNIAASCAAAGITSGTVYRWRMTSAEFRARWAVALREGYAKLELMLIERAMNGTVKTSEKGGVIDRTHEYPNNVAMSLLRMHRDSAAASEAEHDPEELEEVRRRIARKLGIAKERLAGEEATKEQKSG